MFKVIYITALRHYLYIFLWLRDELGLIDMKIIGKETDTTIRAYMRLITVDGHLHITLVFYL